MVVSTELDALGSGISNLREGLILAHSRPTNSGRRWERCAVSLSAMTRMVALCGVVLRPSQDQPSSVIHPNFLPSMGTSSFVGWLLPSAPTM